MSKDVSCMINEVYVQRPLVRYLITIENNPGLQNMETIQVMQRKREKTKAAAVRREGREQISCLLVRRAWKLKLEHGMLGLFHLESRLFHIVHTDSWSGYGNMKSVHVWSST